MPISKSKILFLKVLQNKRKRLDLGLFLVQGKKNIIELLKSDFEIHSIYADGLFLQSLKNNKLREIEYFEVSENELKQISTLETNQDGIAIAKMKANAPQFSKGWTIVLDGITDPGNMGTILRTCDWFGIKNIVCSSDSVDFYNPKTISATMGSFTRITPFYTDLKTWWNNQENKKVFGATLSGNSLRSLNLPKEGIFVLGSESHGIREENLKQIDQEVKILGSQDCESLNVGVAFGIICYELSK